MKRANIWVCGALILLGVASCELKKDLFDSESPSTDYGMLELSVAVKQPASTKATGTTPATDDFQVIVTAEGTSGTNVWEYTVGTLPEEILLAVGTYSVVSHSPGEIEKQMSAPYYAGEKELEISKDITSEVELLCTMQNSRVEVIYTDEFLEAFKSWTILIDDGAQSTYTFTNEDVTSTVVYWYFEDNTTSLTVHISAETMDGTKIQETRIFTKSNAVSGYESGVDPNFSGGDAVEITMGVTDSNSGKVTDVEITAEVTFEDQEESVTIPAIAGETESGGTASGAITITEPNGTDYLTNGIDYKVGSAYPTDVELAMAVTNGIQNMYVRLETTNIIFRAAARDLGLVDGDGMDLVSDAAADLGELFALPTVGDKIYSFYLSESLWSLLEFFTGTHSFILTVIDAEGNSESVTLVLRITE